MSAVTNARRDIWDAQLKLNRARVSTNNLYRRRRIARALRKLDRALAILPYS